jgi:mono/diheme cytochrome c family protein
MSGRKLNWATLILIALAACTTQPPGAGQDSQATPGPHTTITGKVIDTHGEPVPDAIVRLQATNLATTTNEQGSFELGGVPTERAIRLTAFAAGYYILEVDTAAGATDVVFELHAHTDEDNPDYEWLPAGEISIGEGENTGCAECHSADAADLAAGVQLPYDDWLQDAHSQSAVNVRFLTMYSGTDVNGNPSPPTRFVHVRDYGRTPLPPDLTQPYYGPGYKLDFPDTAGNCAACHLPAAAINAPYSVDPTTVTGVGAEGVTCDLCHKVWVANLDADTGLPHSNRPGVLSFEFRRPPEGHQFFAGPYDDVAPGEDTYSPLQQESAYCASCHFGVFWDTQIYNSYGEWLASPYSDPDSGQTCQACHMPPSGVTHFARSDVGGLERDPETIFSHRMPGASDETLLQNAVSMEVSSERQDDQVVVAVDILNDRTGHHVPTDSPLRHMILLVQATDAAGETLVQLDGPTVPEWGGEGDSAQGYYAGLPGTAYAKVLEELWTGVSPTATQRALPATPASRRLGMTERRTPSSHLKKEM